MVDNERYKNSIFICILITSGFLFLWRLGDVRLTNWDEAWYADIARTMALEGNFLTPVWNTKPFLEKPPLYFWLTAFSMHILGPSEFSARFVSAASSIAAVVLLYWFAKKRWGVSAATVSTFVLLSTPAYLWRGRTGNLDSLLSFLIFFSSVAAVEAKHNVRWWIVMGISVGLAFLTKGAVGFIVPIVAFGLCLYQRSYKNMKGLFLAIGIGVAISTVWFLLSYTMNGELFASQFLAQQGEKVSSTTSLRDSVSLEYLSHFKTGFKLWSLFLIPSLLYSFLKWRKGSELVFSFFIVVFMTLLSFLEIKSTWFLLPLYPFAALIIGWSIAESVKYWKYGRPFVWLSIAVVALFQIFWYRHEYFVPDISSDEALVAIASQELTRPGDIIYLTHYYYPTAVYYSRRPTYAVYSERPSVSWWILPKSAWTEIFYNERVFINTSSEDLQELHNKFPTVLFEVLFRSGDKLLVKKREKV